MWMVGDWGQASPWSRDTGVMMVKGENDVWTGELSLPKGTKFNIKILKSTVSETSGGANTWPAVRYASTLNNSASHDFGEFADNLIPNGNFDEGKVKWTPAGLITANNTANSLPNVVTLNRTDSIASDTFVVPPNQTLRLTGYYRTWNPGISGTVLMQIVSPQQGVLHETKFVAESYGSWASFSDTFTTGEIPLECSIKLTESAMQFDSLSLVSP